MCTTGPRALQCRASAQRRPLGAVMDNCGALRASLRQFLNFQSVMRYRERRERNWKLTFSAADSGLRFASITKFHSTSGRSPPGLLAQETILLVLSVAGPLIDHLEYRSAAYSVWRGQRPRRWLVECERLTGGRALLLLKPLQFTRDDNIHRHDGLRSRRPDDPRYVGGARQRFNASQAA